MASGRRMNVAESRAVVAGLQRYEAKYGDALKALAQARKEIAQEFVACGLAAGADQAWMNYVLRYVGGCPENLGELPLQATRAQDNGRQG